MDQLGSDMLVDQDYDEKQEVAIISPEDAMEDAEPEPEVRADDHDAVKKRFFQELPDLETEAEAVSTWTIKNWRSLTKRENGPTFECAGHPWRILFFPFGNNVDQASFYLEHGFEDKPPEDWYACVQFMLVLWNPSDPTMQIRHNANHRFNAEEGDWGFTRFAELRKLFGPDWEGKGRPMVENESCNITAYVRVLKDPTGVLWHSFQNYDSKKETGLVGLKNQGATCYLNSLLQSLYFTSAFRKAVYQIPTENEQERATSAYALQRLFHQLQTSLSAVSTMELTQSFGWDSRQIFEQQDVQELSRILMDRMDEKMKGTAAENALEKMFVGKMKTYISCINVDYESSRIEDFWDVQLNVSGNKGLDDSFKDYIQVETMEGDNAYFAEGFGLQDAKKGVIFESFPPVLNLQLKRFEYDFNRDTMMKVNDRYEFPEVWDASPYLSETADRSEPWVYHLHGVLVHSGDLNAGHYYAFLKPEKDGMFYKFDDDRVTKATRKEAMEENYGGDYAPVANGAAPNGQRNPYTKTWSTKRSMSAYMLVYIRETRRDHVLLPSEKVEAPPHLAQRIAEERAVAERRRKEREEAYLYMEVNVATEGKFKQWDGFDVVPWKSDFEHVSFPKSYRVLRSTSIEDFTKMVAEDSETTPDMLRPWCMVNRQNGTVRPDTVIPFPNLSVEEAAAKYGTRAQTGFRMYFESAVRKDESGNPIFGDASIDLHGIQNNKPIMLFLKQFDAESQTLKGVGNFYAAWHDKVSDISGQIIQLLGWPAGTSLKFFEEIKQTMIEPMKAKQTLMQSELQDGDIITVQKSLSEEDAVPIAAVGGCTDVRDFYDYLVNKCEVTFVPKADPDDEEKAFTLTLSKKMTYDQFAAKVGEHLHADGTHLRFTTINQSGRPKAVVKRAPSMSLATILFPTSYGYNTTIAPRPDQLFYEVLELSLTELENCKTVKVSWLPEGICKEEPYEILVPKTGDISDLLSKLAKKANIPEDVISNCRCYEGHSNKFYKVLEPNINVLSINEFFTIFVEPIPEEERTTEEYRDIPVFHFDKEPNKSHGIPFKFMLKEGEPFKETKERLSDRTGFKGKALDKIKFALVPRGTFSKPQYLESDDILTDLISPNDKDTQLGLDHMNKSRNTWAKQDQIFIR